MLLTQRPFFIGVLTLVLVCLCHDLSLSEEGDGGPDPFVQIFLVDFRPMSISSLFADLNPFKNLLLVGFECGEILWGEHVGRAMKTRQLHEFADDFV